MNEQVPGRRLDGEVLCMCAERSQISYHSCFSVIQYMSLSSLLSLLLHDISPMRGTNVSAATCSIESKFAQEIEIELSR